jgi:hypothetical protein
MPDVNRGQSTQDYCAERGLVYPVFNIKNPGGGTDELRVETLNRVSGREGERLAALNTQVIRDEIDREAGAKITELYKEINVQEQELAILQQRNQQLQDELAAKAPKLRKKVTAKKSKK